MHFWGQSAWLRITFGDLVGERRRLATLETPRQARSHPEQRQVHVLLLFVAPSDYCGCFDWGTLRSGYGPAFPRPATRPRSPFVIRQHAVWGQKCMLTYHKRRS